MNSGELELIKIIWQSGYVVKGVLLLLIIASAASWGIVFFKRNVLRSIQKNGQVFYDIYVRKSDSWELVLENVKNLPSSPHREIFYRAYEELGRLQSQVGGESKIARLREHFREFGLHCVERAMQCGVQNANREMERGLSVLASIGSVSPFVGLFGTVWGIIDSFSALAGGGGTLQAVAPGIAEALVATAVGLAAAIPAVWFFNYFNNSIAEMNSRLHAFQLEMLNSVEEKYCLGW